MKGKRVHVVSVTCFLLLAFSQGCGTVGFRKGGTIVPIAEPAKETRARVIAQFNKATALLAACRDEKTGALDPAKLDEAIAAYEEVEKIDPNDAQTQKQLGIICEFLKNDEKAVYTHYARYIALGGTEPEIVSIVKELATKHGFKE
jgi:tetratricopeptide (TPR) repeat protein